MPRIELTFDIKTDKPWRRYAKGDIIGNISLNGATHRWHWWGWETEWNTYCSPGFASFDEAIRNFGAESHPEPIEFDGLQTPGG